jgi:hypothetical protein
MMVETVDDGKVDGGGTGAVGAGRGAGVVRFGLGGVCCVGFSLMIEFVAETKCRACEWN